jgi:hypothetical protein
VEQENRRPAASTKTRDERSSIECRELRPAHDADPLTPLRVVLLARAEQGKDEIVRLLYGMTVVQGMAIALSRRRERPASAAGALAS